jgi:xylitol oxidase
MPGTNWAGNLTYSARGIVAPRSLDELAEAIVGHDRVRALGSRHSFNDIADTDGTHISLAALPDRAHLDGERVRVPAGMRYGELAPWLHERGRALANLASLPHISVAGAVATGTHGSGRSIGSLATQVDAVEMITAGGEPIRMARGDADFAGAVVSLGSLGIVTALELRTEPAYELRQTVYEGARWDAVLDGFDAVQSAGDSVSLFTTWRDPDAVDQIWVKTRGETADLRAVGAVPAAGPRHPLPGIDPAPCTEQGGVPGPWFDRLPHFRLGFTPSAGAEVQSEYVVPRADAVEAITALRSMATRLSGALQVCEVRTIAADDLWLSPAYGTDAVGLHFTWLPDLDRVTALLPEIEAALPPTARPHWGKVSTLAADAVAPRFPRWRDFAELARRLDPGRRFANRFSERLGL